MTNPQSESATPETVAELRKSFYYGARSDMNFKFANDLTDDEFGQFLSELFAATTDVVDGGDSASLIDVAYRWQVQGYSGHLGDPADFRYTYDDVPFTAMAKPLADSRLLLLTSSGHFVEGDDPQPLGVQNMSQSEAEKRVSEMMKEPPTLSAIPIDTPSEKLRVRHGGYPTEAARSDAQVVLPIEHLKGLVANGVIGELVEDAFSFVGATSQGKLKATHAPDWAEMAKERGADAALLVPI